MTAPLLRVDALNKRYRLPRHQSQGHGALEVGR